MEASRYLPDGSPGSTGPTGSTAPTGPTGPAGGVQTPVDWEARRKALGELHTSLAVEAGAGTGKTTLLVGRILNLVRAGVARLEEIVAITFTEKAAGELKQRLREGLEDAPAELAATPPSAATSQSSGTSPSVTGAAEEAGEGDGDGYGYGADEAGRGTAVRRLSQALSEIDRAPISTIHSFAGTLLRERPIEAGIDPLFEQLDGTGADILFDEVWRDWLAGEMQVHDQGADGEQPDGDQADGTLRRALLTGITLNQIEELAHRLFDERDLDPPARPADPSIAAREFCERFGRDVDELSTLAEQECADPGDNGLLHIQELVRQAEALREASGDRWESAFLSLKVRKNKGSQKNWRSKEACKEQKEICAALADDLAALQGQVKGHILAALVDWLQGFLERMDEVKRERGVLDFQDLLLLTRNLLRENKEVRRYFQSRYRVLLVDEFQDTDPLQAEIAFFLAEAGAAADEWQEARVAPGRLFLVGDPKQSIYRFRRAEMELYRLARDHLVASGGEALAIVENFRTVPGVIDWVNRFFEPLTQEEDVSSHQPAYQPLTAHRRPLLQGPEEGSGTDKGLGAGESVGATRPVVMLAPGETLDLAEAKSEEVRRAEAGAIAAYIREQVDAPLTVYDKGLGKERPASYRDIAILFPKRTALDLYEEQFKAVDIPYRVEGGKSFYRRQEVHELLDALAAVDNPLDEVAVVSALRSCFGVSDADLYAHRRKTSHERRSGMQASPWDYRRYPDIGDTGASPANGPDEDVAEMAGVGSPAVTAAFAELAALHERRTDLAPSGMIARLLERARLLELHYLQPHGEQAVANLSKLIDDARSLESRGIRTLRSAVRRLREMEGQGRDEAESPVAEEDDDSVRFLTMHAAKGLEFPVVILADLNGRRSRTEGFIVDRAAGTFVFKLGNEEDGFQTARYRETSDEERRRMKAEDQRLLYVAATRARDQLVVPLFSPEKTDGFLLMLESVEGALGGDGVVRRTTDEWTLGTEKVPAFRPGLDSLSSGEGLDGPSEAPPRSDEPSPPGARFIRDRDRRRAERAGLLTRAAEGSDVVAAGEWGSREGERSFAGGDERGERVERADGDKPDDPAEVATRPGRPEPGGARASEAAALGEAVHGALERAPLQLEPGEIAAAAEDLAFTATEERGISGRAGEAAEMVAQVLRSPLWGRVGRAMRCERELPFTVPLGDELVEGVVDLVLAEADGLTVVDYKTDRVQGQALEARFAAYRGQGTAYARALEAATGSRVNAVHFLFVRSGEVRVLEPDEESGWGQSADV